MNIMPPKSYVQAVSQPQRSTYQKDPDVGEGVTKGTVQSFTGRAGQKEGGHQGSVVDGQADGQNVEAGQSGGQEVAEIHPYRPVIRAMFRRHPNIKQEAPKELRPDLQPKEE